MYKRLNELNFVIGLFFTISFIDITYRIIFSLKDLQGN